MARRTLFIGTLFIPAATLLPGPLSVIGFIAAGTLLVASGWSNSRGWQRWWPLGCELLAILSFALSGMLGAGELLGGKAFASVFVMFVIAGLVPSFIELMKVSWSAFAAVFDGLKTIREIRRRGSAAG